MAITVRLFFMLILQISRDLCRLMIHEPLSNCYFMLEFNQLLVQLLTLHLMSDGYPVSERMGKASQVDCGCN